VSSGDSAAGVEGVSSGDSAAGVEGVRSSDSAAVAQLFVDGALSSAQQQAMPGRA
jgi:hypothetical protein